MTQKKLLWRLLALLAVFSLVAAACGDDDDDTDTTDGTVEPADDGTADDDAEPTDDDADEPTDDGTDDEATDDEAMADDPFAGCGDQAETDISLLTSDRDVARCDPGYPMPVPLEERQTIRMSSSFRLEFIAPILLADAFGEFEKENLDFEFIDLAFSDAIPQVGTGSIDIAVGGTEAAFFNAIDNDFELRWVLANFFPPASGDTSVPQTGLWARTDVFSDPDNPDITELEGLKLASAVGFGSSIAYPIQAALGEAGLMMGREIDVETIPSPDMVTALENNAVQAAWMLDPLWAPLAEDPDNFVLVATQTPGEPIGGLYAGPSCHTDKRDACVAFLRAIIRTINTYLTGDYKADEEIVNAIAEAISQEPERVGGTPPLLFDWEIREGTTDRMQEVFIGFAEAGNVVVEFDTPFPESQVVDRSIYLDAIGRG